jgi:hypothetical protein
MDDKEKAKAKAKAKATEQAKRSATALLREYDSMKARLRVLEREASRACIDYGVMTGRWGLRLDHLRIEIENEQEKEQTNA